MLLVVLSPLQGPPLLQVKPFAGSQSSVHCGVPDDPTKRVVQPNPASQSFCWLQVASSGVVPAGAQIAPVVTG
jgi:hypothetical protein